MRSASFLESVSENFDRVATLLELPNGLAEKIKIANWELFSSQNPLRTLVFLILGLLWWFYKRSQQHYFTPQ